MKLGEIKYPVYSIIRKHIIFDTRLTFERYVFAVELEKEFDNYVQVKDYDSAYKIYQTVKPKLVGIMEMLTDENERKVCYCTYCHLMSVV